MEERIEPAVLVRGIAIIAVREYVREHLDEEGYVTFLSHLPVEHSRIVQEANRAEWYPVEIIRDLRARVAARFNPQDARKAAFELGLYTSTFEQSTFLRGIMKHLPLHLILKQAASLWKKFYRPGTMQVFEKAIEGEGGEEEGKEGEEGEVGMVALELHDFPAVDPLLCPQFEAWLFTAGKNQNLKNLAVKETLCVHKGDGCCRWEATWNKEQE